MRLNIGVRLNKTKNVFEIEMAEKKLFFKHVCIVWYENKIIAFLEFSFKIYLVLTFAAVLH